MTSSLVKQSRNCERKWRDHSVKVDAVIGLHAVQALHSAHRRFEDGTTRVDKFFTGIQVRLFTDNAIAIDLLHFAVGIGDDPVSTDKLCRYIATVGYCDCVREDISIGVRLGLIVNVACRYFYLDVAFGLAHRNILTYATRQMVTEFDVFSDTDLLRTEDWVDANGFEVARFNVFFEGIANRLAALHERAGHQC